MEKFNMYIDFQNLLLSIERYEEINKIKVFIEENNLFCNQTESLTTMRLLASIIYARPKLIDLTVDLLKQIKKIDIELDLINQNISNDDYIQRTIVLYILLCLSGHVEIKNINTNLKVSQIALIDPVFAFLKYPRNRHLFNNNDFNLINKMPSEMKIKFRNKMHSTHPLVQIIIDDNANLLLEKISMNNIDIQNEIPKSLFEMHKILQNANLIQYAAFLGSVNCFKFLLMKTNYIDYEELFEFAIAGGNYDIIHLIESKIQKTEISKTKILNLAILYMNNDLIKYFIENYEIEINCNNFINCIYSSNFDAINILKSYEYQNTNGSAIFDSIYEYADYVKFLIAIPTIIGLNNIYWWRNLIVESAYMFRKYDVLKYIYKYRLKHDKNNFEGILIPLIITLNYRNEDVTKYFKNIKIHDLHNLFHIDDEDDDYDLDWYEYEFYLFEEMYYYERDLMVLSEDEVVSKKQKERMIKKKLKRKEILKENKAIKIKKHNKVKKQIKRNIILDKKEYLDSNY